ncbi:uncharacterized protein FOMMEDRAFT_59028, partial [Fomitiporia mediterranea MF3/22]|uniref:uncharacterized protein n=1 Tax=Fomitiporia mediterranea (strain MF3/22) TaxID=694068 RepID=UPI0004409B85
VPGMAKENISIDVSKDCLVVKGEAGYKDVEEKGFIHRERRTGRFERTLPLLTSTQFMQPSDVKASLKNGLLTFMFPETSPEQLPQRVII